MFFPLSIKFGGPCGTGGQWPLWIPVSHTASRHCTWSWPTSLGVCHPRERSGSWIPPGPALAVASHLDSEPADRSLPLCFPNTLFFFSKFTMLPISSVFYFSSLYMMPSKLTHHKNGGVDNDCIWFLWGLRLVLMVFLSLWMLEEVHDQSNPIGACILCHLQVGHLLSFHCWTEWGLWEQARLPPRRSWGLSERVTTTDTFHTPGAPKEKWSQGLGLGGNELSSL